MFVLAPQEVRGWMEEGKFRDPFPNRKGKCGAPLLEIPRSERDRTLRQVPRRTRDHMASGGKRGHSSFLLVSPGFPTGFFGSDRWQKKTARGMGLEFRLRPRGRPRTEAKSRMSPFFSLSSSSPFLFELVMCSFILQYFYGFLLFGLIGQA
jgi:hypothetical protein